MANTRNGLLCTLVALIFAASIPTAMAQSDTFSVGPNISTLGVGAEASTRMGDYLVLRVGGNYLELMSAGTYGDLDYDLDVKLASVGAALDLHPFANGFLISAGLYRNGNGADLTTEPTTNVTLGDTTFTPAEAGRINGNLEFNAFAPYVGIGYDNAHFTSGPWSFNIRVGLFYMGDPEVTLAATGALAGTAAFEAELRREEDQIEDDLSALGFYPAVTIGLMYRF